MRAAQILAGLALAGSALSAALPSAITAANVTGTSLPPTTTSDEPGNTDVSLHSRFENYGDHTEDQERNIERDDSIDEGSDDQDVEPDGGVEENNEEASEEASEEPNEPEAEPERPPNTNDRGVIDINPLPDCVRACFIHARWDKFDVLNLTPDEFCVKSKIFYWDSFYLGPCMRKHCDREVAKPTTDWFKETCPKIYDGKSWLTGSPMHDD